ncbi:MAG: hypothetical protein R6W92_08560 [Desulfocurvibacter africanus]
MPTCFVIQPFDGGKFDKRFHDVYKPAIEAADLEPYRVDQDPHVSVPIAAIEDGIRSAAICIAEITEDNPNVWYELGFAFASGTPVVMVCSRERAGKKYPFDIQHRTIISYQEDSISDFEKLRNRITERLKALVEQGATLRQIAESEQIAPVKGLTQSELIVLATIAGSVPTPGDATSVHAVKSEVERAGWTSLGFTLGLKKLDTKGFVYFDKEYNFNDTYQTVGVTETGWEWIDANESFFTLKKKSKKNDEIDMDTSF